MRGSEMTRVLGQNGGVGGGGGVGAPCAAMSMEPRSSYWSSEIDQGR